MRTVPASGWGLLVVFAALTWHVAAVLSPAWIGAARPHNGRDFASYYYAARVATNGGDPYDRPQLNQMARSDGARGGVHPFFYPPPFVAGSAWVAAFDLHGAFRIWFWLDEVMAVLAGLVLFLWWRDLSPLSGPVVVALLALMTAVPNNHAMGQANLVVLVVLLGGLMAEDRGKPVWAGVLVGMACMMKMSPALFVAWWLLRRRWWAAGTACVTALVLSVASLPVVGVVDQVRFYTEILPKFATGDYNGLSIPIELFGNHSIPNLLHQVWPSGDRTLSDTAASLGRVATLLLVGGLGAWFGIRPGPEDRWTVAGQAASVGVAMLLIPVYTYEHHLVWAVPAAVLAVLASGSGRLPLALSVPAGLAITVLLFDLQALKALFLDTDAFWPAIAVQELKTAAIAVLLVCTAWVGRGVGRS
ncbi:MAG: glycosyltransferase family 87 protein [Myxococcota bacterium]